MRSKLYWLSAVAVASVVVAAPAPARAAPASTAPASTSTAPASTSITKSRHLGLRLELGLMFGYDERQIEGPGRDDKVTQDFSLHLNLSVLYRVWRGLGVGLLVNYDRSLDRLVASGDPASAWEMNLGLLVRYTAWKYFFAQAGYLFLMMRNDSFRSDLPNESGDASSVLFGSHSVAWLIGLGAQLPLSSRIHLLFKLDYRIRYFVRRGGAPLQGGQEYGGQTLAPYLGVAYTF